MEEESKAIFLAKLAYIETHGCQMNVHDSERAASLLAAVDYEIVDSPERANLILLNTCAVREKASSKVYSRVAQLRSRTSGVSQDLPIIGVLGCVAQSEAEALFDRSPDVRIVLGPSALSSLPSLVQQIEDGFPRAIDIRRDSQPDFLEISAHERQSKHLAYVTIIEGCDKACSYCIVPYTRGRERSRVVESVLDEVRSLAQAGFKEVQLLGQNVNSYRGTYRSANGICSFAELLKLVAEQGGFRRVRYTTSHPVDFSNEILQVMDDHPSLCNWIHLPVQSGSSRVLRAMRREYTRENYLKKVEAIRKAKRDYAITTDIIVGFPGESEEDFKQTLSLVEEVQFDGAYTFKYSPRPHSSASIQPDDISSEVKQDRLERLISAQSISQQYVYSKYLGRTLNVLIESSSPRGHGELTGHSTCNKVVNIKGQPELIGAAVPVLITDIRKNSLFGSVAPVA